MSAQLQRFNINFRRSIPAEADLVQAANQAAMPAAVYLRGAALAGHALLAAGCRLLEDGSLLVPGPGGALVQLRPAEIIAVARRRDILQGGEVEPTRSSGHAAPARPNDSEPAPAPAPRGAAPQPAPAPPPLPRAAPPKAEAATAGSSEDQGDGTDSEQNEIADTALRSLGLHLG